MLCVADPSWSLDLLDFGSLLLCYHLPYHYFRLVSCMLPFNTCISPDHLVYATWPPDLLLFGKTLLVWPDLPRLLSISWRNLLPDYYPSLVMIGYLLYIITLSCYHFIPSMIYLTCNYHLYGDLDLWFCVMISDLYSCFTCSDLTICICVLLIPDHVHFLFFP